MDVPIQWVKFRLVHAWGWAVGSHMAGRAEFQGINHVDVMCSNHTDRNIEASDGGLLTVVKNGSFYTRNKQKQAGKVPDTKCPFCGEEDGVAHRTWHCLREVGSASKSNPDCTKLHGWMDRPFCMRPSRRGNYPFVWRW